MDNTKGEFNDHSPESLIAEAIRYQNSGEVDKALTIYTKASLVNPDNSEIFYQIGMLFKLKGQLNEAETNIRKAIFIQPDFVDAYINLGLILQISGRLIEARHATLQAINLSPHLVFPYINLADIMIHQGRADEAQLITIKAISVDPYCPYPYSNLAGMIKGRGLLLQSKKLANSAIKLMPELAEAYSNLSSVLNEMGRLDAAEIAMKFALRSKRNEPILYLNLAGLLMQKGDLDQAEKNLIKGLNLDDKLNHAHFLLSQFSDYRAYPFLRDQLFKSINDTSLKNKEDIDLMFAASNLLHRERRFKESTRYLKQANDYKLALYPSDADKLINRTNEIYNQTSDCLSIRSQISEKSRCLFIVGMPRSGSTLIDSILSMNPEVMSLGEVGIFDEAMSEWHEKSTSDYDNNLYQIYLKRRSKYGKNLNITTDKYLYNYRHVALIASEFPCVQILNCYRNPLDNILSLYRANFKQGNYYSSSLDDSARVLINKEQVMKKFKSKYPLNIYDINYDQLVKKPKQKIRELISWLGWDWSDSYLSPQKNPRSIQTASCIQVRNPINAKSVGGWRNYKELLAPAIEILQANNIDVNYID